MAEVSSILARAQANQQSTVVERDVPIDLDVGLLAAFDSQDLDDSLYSTDREACLQASARDGVQTLVNALFSLPTTSTPDCVLANLPATGPTTPLPRAKPLPKPTPLTKWQQFSKDKGIAPKAKKDKLVWDEAKGEWVNRWGWKGKNKDEEEAWIREVKPNEDADALERNPAKKTRKERMLKNEKQRLKNLERAAAASTRTPATPATALAAKAGLPAGPQTTVKSKAEVSAQKIAANAAKTAAEGAAKRAEKAQRRSEIERQLKETKRSTASLGKFDKKFEGEPKAKGVKRKFEAAEQPVAKERPAQLAVADRLARDPTAFTEKTVKRGSKKARSSADAASAPKGEELVNVRKAIRHASKGAGAGAMGLGKSGRKKGRK